MALDVVLRPHLDHYAIDMKLSHTTRSLKVSRARTANTAPPHLIFLSFQNSVCSTMWNFNIFLDAPKKRILRNVYFAFNLMYLRS